MTIKVYESIMPGEPAEVYDYHGGSVESFVRSMTDNYRPGDVQPISCMVNGRIVKPADWTATDIGQSDVVEFRPVPRGDAGDVLSFVFPTIFAPLVAPGRLVEALIDIPGQSGGTGQQGSRIDPASARANAARLGQGIPELFGRYIRYPDYLVQPRSYYQDTRTRVTNLFLCVGVGEYDINASTVKIGDTQMGRIDSASYSIYQPGTDVSSLQFAENWHTSREVGGTQSSSGLRLKGITYDQRTYFGGAALATGDTITSFSTGSLWEPGVYGSLKIFQNITISNTGGSPDTFTGAFDHLSSGDTVTIESTVLNGNYVITSINATKTEITLEETGGTPVESTAAGTYSMWIDKANTQYRITDVSALSIDVERILLDGTFDNNQLPEASPIDLEIVWVAESFTSQSVGPFSACPDGETTDTFEVDIFAPEGLGSIDGESVNSKSMTVRIEWREVGTTTYTAEDHELTASTRDQLGWTFSVSLPSSIRPEVRISRIGEESTDIGELNKSEWQALRAKLPAPSSYEGVTTMAVEIIGTDEIGSASNDRINLVATRKLPPVAGGAATATRSIARAATYVARSLGYEDDQLDIAELERLDAIWDARGDTFDFVFSDGTAKDAIDKILRAGFAEMTLDNGVITPVRDEPRTQYEQGYGPENMSAPLVRSFTGKQPDEPDGVEVEYTKDGTWTEETVQCFLPGDLGVKVDKIKLDGVTDETRAWRIGMRRRRGQRYRRWEYSFETELDALNSQYLSYVPLVDQIPGYGQPCILTGIESDRITVSEPIEWEAGVNYVVAYRDENGDTQGPFPATEGPDENTILVTIPQPWPAVLPGDREPTHVYFGPVERWSFPSLITEIRPQGPLSASVSAVNYDERVYLSDDDSPP